MNKLRKSAVGVIGGIAALVMLASPAAANPVQKCIAAGLNAGVAWGYACIQDGGSGSDCGNEAALMATAVETYCMFMIPPSPGP